LAQPGGFALLTFAFEEATTYYDRNIHR